MWYLECYSYGALGGRDFPVNTYCHEDRRRLAEAGARILCNEVAGIDEVRLTREPKGVAPLPLDFRGTEAELEG